MLGCNHIRAGCSSAVPDQGRASLLRVHTNRSPDGMTGYYRGETRMTQICHTGARLLLEILENLEMRSRKSPKMSTRRRWTPECAWRARSPSLAALNVITLSTITQPEPRKSMCSTPHLSIPFNHGGLSEKPPADRTFCHQSSLRHWRSERHRSHMDEVRHPKELWVG